MDNTSRKDRMKNFTLLWTPALLATVALICGFAANTYCETVQFRNENNNINNNNNNNNNNGDLILFAGVFSYRTRNYEDDNNNNNNNNIGDEREEDAITNSGCRSYTYLDRDLEFDFDLDAKTRTTRAFAIMAGIIGTLAVFFLYLLPCTRMGNNNNNIHRMQSRRKQIGNIFFVTCLFQGITLLITNSSICNDNPVLQYLDLIESNLVDTFPETCEWAAGYRLNITSVVFWFLAGIATYVMIPSKISSSREEVQHQTVTYQQNADGTVTEEKVTIVKGNTVAVAIEEQEETIDSKE